MAAAPINATMRENRLVEPMILTPLLKSVGLNALAKTIDLTYHATQAVNYVYLTITAATLRQD